MEVQSEIYALLKSISSKSISSNGSIREYYSLPHALLTDFN